MSCYQNIKESDKKQLYQYTLTTLEKDQYSSIYNAAKSLSISKTILSNRVKGQFSRSMSHTDQQNLSDFEEIALAKWIITLIRHDLPPYTIIREIAESIRNDRVISINDNSIERVDYLFLGKHWASRFIKRHP